MKVPGLISLVNFLFITDLILNTDIPFNGFKSIKSVHFMYEFLFKYLFDTNDFPKIFLRES